MIDVRVMDGQRTQRRLAIRALALTVLLALVASAVWAGSDLRKGTAGAPELLIPVGPRGSALGGTTTSDVDGIEAAFWNPSGLAGIQGTEVLFSHMSYIADMKVNFAAAAVKAGGVGVLGVAAKVLSVGDIAVTTEQAPDGTGEILDPTFTVLGVMWAKQFTDRVRFGSTLNLISEHVGDNSATGMAVDFGVQYDTGWRGLKFGMVMKDFGPSMAYSGPGFDIPTQLPGSDPSSATRVTQLSSAAFELPSHFTFGTSYDFIRRGHTALRLLGSFQNNNFSGDTFAGGAEWSYRDVFALRGSWYGTLDENTDPATGNSTMTFASGDDIYSGYALGGGIVVPAGGTNLAVDLAWRPVRNYFDDTIEMGVRMKF